MFAQIFAALVSYFVGQLTGSSAKPGLLDRISMAAVRKAALVFTGLIVTMIVLAAGLLTVLVDLILSSREAQQLWLSPVSIVGFSLLVLSGVALALSFRRSLWNVPSQQRTVETEEQQPPLAAVSAALASYLHDLAEERRVDREQRDRRDREHASMAPNPPPYAERGRAPLRESWAPGADM